MTKQPESITEAERDRPAISIPFTEAMRHAGVEALASFEEGDGVPYGDRVEAIFRAALSCLPIPDSEKDFVGLVR